MLEQQKRASVCMVLIHNKDSQRLNYIRPALEQLSNDLSKNYKTIIVEPSFRPEIVPHSTFFTLQRDAMYLRLEREWCQYRLLKEQPLLLEILSFLKKSFDKYVSSNGRSVLVGRRRNSFREMVLTENHIHGWSTFLAMGADFMICFEDDAVFKDDSSQRVISLLDNLSQKSQDALIYVDLAGGCDHDALKIDNLETGEDASFRFYIKPVTNTACSYLINRSLATFFIERVFKKPKLRQIGADWLMNKLFILAAHDGIKCTCMHASPTIFKHGSVTGEYASLLSPDRQT
jgi:hypothetical protein